VDESGIMRTHMGTHNVSEMVAVLGTPWGWVVSVTPRPSFTSWARTPGTHWIGGWVSFRDGLDTEARGKILCLNRGSKSGRPVCCQALHWLSYPGSSHVQSKS
jgi:hypothetical protein